MRILKPFMYCEPLRANKTNKNLIPIMEVTVSSNYDALTADNRDLVDEFIDFLVARQKKNQKVTREAMREFEVGKSIGPFDSAKDLMADLYA